MRHELVMNVAMGKSIDDMAKQLEPETLTTNFYNRKRLIRTELVKYYSRTTIERYKNAGITEIQVHACMDNRTCEVCKENNNKKYPIDKCPIPFHPNCRCWITPVI